MINYLTLHLPNSTITVESDDVSALETLSKHCKENLGAYHETEDINELTVTNLTSEQSDKLYSLMHELSLL